MLNVLIWVAQRIHNLKHTHTHRCHLNNPSCNCKGCVVTQATTSVKQKNIS